MTRLIAVAIPLLAFALVPAARAATGCTVAATGSAFGNYDPSSAVPATTTADIAVSCAAIAATTVPVTVMLGGGNSGKVAARAMTSGSGTLSYALTSDAAHAVPWGDGSGGTGTVPIDVVVPAALTAGRADVTAFGIIPAGQLAAPGTYLDTVLVTVSF